MAIVEPKTAAATFVSALPVCPLDMAVQAEPGAPDASSAPAAIASIRRAVADVMAGSAAAVVTNPVAKNVLYRSGFAEPGHTEFLARLVQEATGKSLHPVMMLWSPELAVVPVTIHLPLRNVLKELSAGARARNRTHRGARSRHTLPSGAASPRRRRAQSPCRRGRNARRGGPQHRCARRGAAARRGHRRTWTTARQFHVSRGGARELRRGAVHVSRPGADPDQDAGVRSRRQCHAGSAVRAHFTRPRHRLRHRRHRPRQSIEPGGGAAACGTARRYGADRATAARRDRRGRRAAAAARRHPPPRPRRQKIARTELPARPQPHRAHRTRGGTARRCHRGRSRSRPRRAHARAARSRRAPRDRDRARRPRHRCTGGNRRALPRPPRHHCRRCA